MTEQDDPRRQEHLDELMKKYPTAQDLIADINQKSFDLTMTMLDAKTLGFKYELKIFEDPEGNQRVHIFLALTPDVKINVKIK